MGQEFEFTIGFDAFDASLLPVDARTPGTGQFVAAVQRLVERELAGHGGWARIVADETSRQMRVTWGPGATGYDPLESAVARLARGDYASAVQTRAACKAITRKD